ncbi:uncharacterized protein LOC106670394 isoform X2 [Cimex lectularius]|uniref:Uncharacterized protein n=1 Tax=Cimex lectularius TaxID=79782 RepID=A0A8I6S182_CIMLE|nr:uncharacterized protein LOC106670394 isoform X2 [Cimex lectularius]
MLREQISQTVELALFTFEQSAQTDEKNKSTKEEVVQTYKMLDNKTVQTENVALAISEECTQTEDNSLNAKHENIQTETAIICLEEQMVQTEENPISVCEQSFQTEENCTNIRNESVQTLPRIVKPIEQTIQTESTAISAGVQTEEVVKYVSEQFTLTEEACVSNGDQAMPTLEEKNKPNELVQNTIVIDEGIVQTEEMPVWFYEELTETVVNDIQNTEILESSSNPMLNSNQTDSDDLGEIDNIEIEFNHYHKECVMNDIESFLSSILANMEAEIVSADPISSDDSLPDCKFQTLLPEFDDNMKERLEMHHSQTALKMKPLPNINSKPDNIQSPMQFINEELDRINLKDRDTIIMSGINAKEEKLNSKLILNEDFQVDIKDSFVTELESKMEETTIDTLNNGVIDFDCEDEDFGLDKLFCHNNAETCNFASKDKRMKYTRPCSLILSLKYRPLFPNLIRNRRKKPPRTNSNIDRPQAYNKMTERVNLTKNRDTFVEMENNDYKFSLIGTLPRCDEEGLQDEIVEPQQLQTFTDNKLHLQNGDGNVGNHNSETRKKHKTIKHYSRPCSIVFRLKSQSVPLNVFTHKTKMGRLKSKSAMECDTDIKNKLYSSRNVEKIKQKQTRRFFSSLPPENHTTSLINVWDYFTRSPFKRTYDGDYTDIINSGFQPNRSTDNEWVRKLPKSEEHKCLEDIGDLDFQEFSTNKYSAEESPTLNIPLLKSASDVSASETSDDEKCTNVKFKVPTLLPANQGQMRVIQAWPENGNDIKFKTRQKKKMVERLAPINLLIDEEYVLRKKESKKFDRVIIEDLSTEEFETVTHLKPCHIEIANNEQKTEYQQKINTFNANTENLNKQVKFFSVQNEPQRFDDLIIEDLATETFDITSVGLKPRCFEIHKNTQDHDYRKRDVRVHAQETDHPLKSENGYSSSLLQDDGIVWVKPLHSPNADNRSIDNRIEKKAFLPMHRSQKYKSTDTKCSLLTKELRPCEDVRLDNVTRADKDNAIMNAFGSMMDLCNDNLKDSITRHLELNLPITSPQKINRTSGLINLNNEINLSSSFSKQSPSSKISLIPTKKCTNASSLRKITYSTRSLSSKGIYSSYSPIKLMLRKNLYTSKCKSCPDIYRRFKSNLRKHKVNSIGNKKSLGKIYPESNKQLNSMKYNEYLHELRKCNQVKYSVDCESRDEDLTIMMECARNKNHKPKNGADNFSASEGNMMNNINNDEITSLELHSLTEMLPLTQNVNVESVSGENGNDKERRTEVTNLKETSKITLAEKNF